MVAGASEQRLPLMLPTIAMGQVHILCDQFYGVLIIFRFQLQGVDRGAAALHMSCSEAVWSGREQTSCSTQCAAGVWVYKYMSS